MKKKESKIKKLFFLKYAAYLGTIVLLLPIFTFAQGESVTLESAEGGCSGSNAFVNLSWTSNINGNPTYYVLRKAQGEMSFSEITSTQNNYYLDKNVNSDKDYVYKIKAVKDSDVFFSEEKLVSAQFCPAVVLSVQALCYNNSPRITLNWSSVSGTLLKYEIYRDNTKIGETINTTFNDDFNLEGTKTYNYFIRTIWQNNNSKDSEIVSKEALACSPSLAVSVGCLTFSPGGPNVNLIWNNLLGVKEYQVYRKGPNESDFSLLKSGLTQTNYTDNLVESLSDYGNGGQVFYRVRAIWETAEKDSNNQQIDIPRCSPYLEIETVCNSSGLLNPEMRLFWTVTKNAIFYNVYRDNVFFCQTGTSICPFQTKMIDYLNESTCGGKICSHSYRVEAVVSGLPNFSSNEVEKDIDCSTVISPSPSPDLNSPVAYCFNGDSRISLSWVPSNNVVYYALYRNNELIANLLETSYIDAGIESNRFYTYRVTAFGRGGTYTDSSNSQTIISLNCVPPSQPVLSLSKGCEAGKPYVNLSWTETTNTEVYEVWRGLSSTNLSLLRSFDKNAPEFTLRNWKDYNVSYSTTYYYQIVSKGPVGVNSSQSNIVNITTFSCLPTIPNVTVSPSCSVNNPVVNLSWTTDKVNTYRYEIFRKDYLSGTVPIAIIYNVDTSNWTDASVLPQTSYIYKVEAVGYLDTQRSSQGWKPGITTYNCSSPGNFTLSLSNLYCQGSYPWAELSWTNSFNSTSYDLIRLISQSTTFSNVTSPFIDRGFGKALNFDGYYDYVNIPNTNSLNPTKITLEAWIFPVSFNYYGNILSKRSPDQYILRLYGYTGQVQGYIYSNGSWRYCTTPSNIAVSLNKWNHILFFYDNSVGKVYINGQLGCTFSYNGSIVSGTNSLKIGTNSTSSTNSERFNGIIDEVRIYNRALSENEVLEHYQGIYNNDSGLVGLWHFDEGSGQTVSDSSNFNNNGTLGGSTAVENSDPNWIESGLQSQKSYQWQAKANGLGGSTFSNTTDIITTSTCEPTKPGLSLSSFCSGSNLPNVTLKWSYTINTIKYEIYRDGNLIKIINQTDPEFSSGTWTDTNNGNGLSENTNYSYYIKSFGPTGLVKQSDLISITTLSCEKPSKPENLQAVFSCSGANNSYPQVSISWNPSNNATSYKIYRNPTSSGFPVSTALTSYVDTTINVKSTYSYYVIAYGPAGSSTPSDSVSVVTDYCNPSIPLITSLTSDCENNNPINNISWSDATPFNTSEYKIYRNTINNIPSAPIKTIVSGTSEFTSRLWKDNIDISFPNTYFYWIKASGPRGESSFSSVKSISVYNCAVVSIPPNLTLQNSFCQDNLPYAVLSWNQVDNAYSYNLFRVNPDNSSSVYSSRLSPLTDRGSFSLSFDGVDDYVSVLDSNSLRIGGDMTIEAWINWSGSSSSYSYIVEKGQNDNDNYGFFIVSGKLGFEFQDSNGTYRIFQESSSVSSLLTNVWQHVAVVYADSQDKIYFYRNGSLTTSSSTTYSLKNNQTNNLLVGMQNYGSNTYRYKGLIDEIRIYNRALNQTEINNHFNNIFKKEIGLAAVWHFDEGSSTTINDESGNNNNGILYNNPTWQKDSPAAIKVLALTNSETYKYKIKAVGSGTESDFSNEITFNLSCLPLKPDLKISSICDNQDSKLSLSWNNDSNTKYWVIYKRRASEQFLLLANISSPQTSFIDNDVESGATYDYYLVAYGVGVSTTSDSISQTVSFCNPLPSKPVISKVNSTCYGYDSRIEINWLLDSTNNTISYNIWRKNISLSEPDFTMVFEGLSKTTDKYVDSVEENNTYVYKVEAVGSGGENTVFSEPTSEITSYECSSIPPFPPVLYLNLIYSLDHHVAVSIGWKDAGNEENYKVFRKLSSEQNFAQNYFKKWWTKITNFIFNNKVLADYDNPIVTLGANILNYVDNTVTDGKSYDYQVAAVNKNGETYSNIITVDIPIARPGDFSLFWEWKKNPIRIHLSWTEALTSEAGGIVKYQVQRDENEEFLSPVVVCDNISLPESLECDDVSFKTSERYYRVKATNNALNPTYSNTIKIELPLPLWKEISPLK